MSKIQNNILRAVKKRGAAQPAQPANRVWASQQSKPRGRGFGNLLSRLKRGDIGPTAQPPAGANPMAQPNQPPQGMNLGQLIKVTEGKMGAQPAPAGRLGAMEPRVGEPGGPTPKMSATAQPKITSEEISRNNPIGGIIKKGMGIENPQEQPQTIGPAQQEQQMKDQLMPPAGQPPQMGQQPQGAEAPAQDNSAIDSQIAALQKQIADLQAQKK